MAIVSEEVTQWIVRLGDGDQQAARILWEEYFAKLVALRAAKAGRHAPPSGRRRRRGLERHAQFLPRHGRPSLC